MFFDFILSPDSFTEKVKVTIVTMVVTVARVSQDCYNLNMDTSTELHYISNSADTSMELYGACYMWTVSTNRKPLLCCACVVRQSPLVTSDRVCDAVT